MSFNKFNESLDGLKINSWETNFVRVCDLQMLQYAQPGNNGECELVIGLDFGTSSSKVVIQAPYLPGRPSCAVNFGQFSSGPMPYLLPTRLWIEPSSGLCTLEARNGYIMVNNIKLELFSKDENLNSKFGPMRQRLLPEETAVCYLALLLRYSRQWFLQTKSDLVRQFSRLRWSLNMGVPSPCIEDNEENQIFRRVGKAAWLLSTLTEDYIKLDRAKRELMLVNDRDYWDDDKEFTCEFAIIPEIAAGAVGYALSELRREGLHVMVDIGASTIDVCTFLLHEREGDNRYSLLISDVQQLGAIRLYTDRISAFKQVCEDHVDYLLSQYDPMAPIDEDIKTYQLLSHDQFASVFEEVRDQLKIKILCMVRRVIWQTKRRRAPGTPVWRKGRLPVLLIGGGSKLQFFRSAVEEIHEWLKYNTRNDGIIILTAPVPDTLANSVSNAEEYQLLAVAWGLSHPSIDIGEIVPADQIPDIEPPPPVNWRKWYIGKELV